MIDEYLAACFSKETQPQVCELANQLGISRGTLTRRFREQFGVSLLQHINSARHQRACGMLLLMKLSLSEIAYRCGYGSRRSFFRAFRAIERITPGEYRERNRTH